MAKTKKLKFAEQKAPTLLRLDLGCGKGAKTPDGFLGVDKVKAPNVGLVLDLAACTRAVNSADPKGPPHTIWRPWPWKTNSVDEVHCDYLLQYLTAAERVHFANELYRVLKPGARATIIVPYWCAQIAYMDCRAQWPPISEGWGYTLGKAWRAAQNFADDSGLQCDFDCTAGYGMHSTILPRAKEFQEHAVLYYKEAVQDLHVTLTKRA